MANLEVHVMRDNVKWLLTFIAFVLCGVMFAGILCGWFDKKDKELLPDEEQKQEQDGGVVTVPEDDEASVPVSLSARKLLRAEYEDYGIETYADSAFVIKATYTDSSITYKELDWSWAWADGSAGKWGNGKQTSTYATGSASSDTLTYTVTIHEAFGEQLVVTAKNRANPDVSKSATFDYARRVTGFTDQYNNVTSATRDNELVLLTETNTNNCNRTYPSGTPKWEVSYEYASVYTLDDTFSYSITATLNFEFANGLKAHAEKINAYSGDVKSAIDKLIAYTQSFDATELDFSAFLNFIITKVGAMSLTGYDSAMAFKGVVAGYHAEHANVPFVNLSYTITGTYSNLTKTVKLGYTAGAFGALAQQGSLNFDKTGFVA